VIPLITQLAEFAGTAALVIVTPGPDTAVTLGSTLSRGRAAGVSTAFGVLCGQAVWTLASSAGLSALLLASEPVFAAVKYAGAAYLVFLGLQALRAAFRNDAHELSGLAADGLPERRGRLACFRRGLLSDLGNPKMAVFFTSLLPQFGSHFAALALLGLARAYALQGDTAKSRAAYQNFFAFWKDADPDIPILKEAKAEYATLQ